MDKCNVPYWVFGPTNLREYLHQFASHSWDCLVAVQVVAVELAPMSICGECPAKNYVPQVVAFPFSIRAFHALLCHTLPNRSCQKVICSEKYVKICENHIKLSDFHCLFGSNFNQTRSKKFHGHVPSLGRHLRHLLGHYGDLETWQHASPVQKLD